MSVFVLYRFESLKAYFYTLSSWIKGTVKEGGGMHATVRECNEKKAKRRRR